ncbi:MAG: hypothetical protein AAFY65_13350 [Pseudomonadota bacterium]
MRDPWTDDPTHPDYRNTRHAVWDIVPVTPSDDDPLPFEGVGLYIEGGAQVSFRTKSGQVRTIRSATWNFEIRVSVTQVLATGTFLLGSDGKAAPEPPAIWVLQAYSD